jgi:hypothetical protein
MSSFSQITIGCAVLGWLAVPVFAAQAADLPALSSKQGVTYATDIKPLLDRSCIKCHGPEKAKAGLRLDSQAGALKGTKEGKIIKPGQSAESKLVHAVSRVTKEPMPPKDKGVPLTAAEVGVVRAWIDQGAK